MAEPMIPPATADRFLLDNGWAGATIEPLAGDASFRRYFRVHRGDEIAVLMDAPPPHEDPKPYIDVAQWLVDAGFSAPRILAKDMEQGLILIEDFGGNRMREALDANPESAEAMYRTTADILAALHTRPAMALPPYDMAQYLREANLFTDWYCPALGLAVDEDSWSTAWKSVLPIVLKDTAPVVTVLRDYHAENIMLLDRAGIQQFGLLDFQDALAGHPAYDLVSMLQDARCDVPETIEAMARRYYAELARPNSQFDSCYAILGAQRNIKILGIFTRLWKRDGKPHYLGFQARVWGYLLRDLKHPALTPIAQWMDANVPEAMRASAWLDHTA
jgi:hypothetical protein